MRERRRRKLKDTELLAVTVGGQECHGSDCDMSVIQMLIDFVPRNWILPEQQRKVSSKLKSPRRS